MKQYNVTTTQVCLQVAAYDKAHAKRIVMGVEGCPESAILNIEERVL